MKKTKILMIIAALLSTVLLLCSCAMEWEDVLVTVQGASKPSYQSLEKVNDLLDAEMREQCDEMVYLTAYTDAGKIKHIVYNLELGRVVYFRVESDAIVANVSFKRVYGTALIVESVTTTALESGASFVTTTLYKPNGVSVATTMNAEPVLESACDLIYFEGKYYRVDGEGAISMAFEYAPTAARPAIFAMSETYYYAQNKDTVAVYTRDGMHLVSHFAFPSYAQKPNFMILSNGNLLVQYMIAETDTANKYTFIYEEEKMTLVTQIFDVEEGELETIEADYLLKYGAGSAVYEEAWQKNGLNREELPNFATVWMIEEGERQDLQENLLQMVCLNDEGEIEDVLTIEGQNVQGVRMIAENRWILTSVLGTEYLVDQEGKVLGQVNNAEYHEARFFVGGRIYDLDLQVVYDYGKDGATLVKKMNNGVILKTYNGDIVCFANGESATVVGVKDATHRFYGAQDGYYIVRDESDAAAVKYDVYNDLGVKIFTLQDVTEPGFVASGEKSCLIFGCNADGKKVYYRLG